MTEGVGAWPASASPCLTNDAGSNPTRIGFSFISWRFHGMKLDILILVRIDLFVPLEQPPVCQRCREGVVQIYLGGNTAQWL